MTTPAPQVGDPDISFIVPVWGDDGLVAALLDAVEPGPVRLEWIVAAVAPGPQLRELAAAGLILLVECAVPSRGKQLNAGAAAAQGRLLCFHHADTQLTAEHLQSLTAILDDQELVGGAFHRRFDDRHRWMLRWEKVIHGIAGSFGPVFGDQSIFVRRDIFQRLGGFADIPLMEDLEFSGRLKAVGQIRLLHPPIWSSPRRFSKLGSWQASCFNGMLILMFYLGVSPQRLHRWYYAGKTLPENAAPQGG